MKKRITTGIVAVATAMTLMTVTPASAYESAWTNSSGSSHPTCGRIEWFKSGNTASISSSGCDWYFYIRGKYNDNGTDYITAWQSGRKGAYVTRLRLVSYQVRY